LWLEDESVRIEVGILGELVNGVFEAGLEIVAALFQGQQDGHEDFTGAGAGIRLGTEAHFPGDDHAA